MNNKEKKRKINSKKVIFKKIKSLRNKLTYIIIKILMKILMMFLQNK
jgi:hypothetical protein